MEITNRMTAVIDWNAPIKTIGGLTAELIDPEFVWEKDLVVKLVRIGSPVPGIGHFTIPCDDDGKYVKALPGDTEFDVVNVVEVQDPPSKAKIYLMAVKAPGAPVPVAVATLYPEHVSPEILSKMTSVEVDLVNLSSTEVRDLLMAIMMAAQKRLGGTQ